MMGALGQWCFNCSSQQESPIRIRIEKSCDIKINGKKKAHYLGDPRFRDVAERGAGSNGEAEQEDVGLLVAEGPNPGVGLLTCNVATNMVGPAELIWAN
jgi:hypothetical protein